MPLPAGTWVWGGMFSADRVLDAVNVVDALLFQPGERMERTPWGWRTSSNSPKRVRLPVERAKPRVLTSRDNDCQVLPRSSWFERIKVTIFGPEGGLSLIPFYIRGDERDGGHGDSTAGLGNSLTA